MARIQRLSQNLVNKIAAGEVIERPASVVKELMENSIDAGATRIDVAIDRGGLELIRIADNGCGMDAEDLILAVTSHATSKLRAEEDLFHVATMGFRGEALASVAEISQMTVRSCINPNAKPTVGEAFVPNPDRAIGGLELCVKGGEYEPPAPCGTPGGTCIEVRNLFFNTPVRRKFLKSPATEFGHISDAFSRLALANPHIHFTLKHNSRSIFELPAVSNWQDRICAVEGSELADGLLYIEKNFGEIRISGFAARPNHSRSNPKMQYLFLNGRPIRDRSLQHALNEAYRGLLTSNRYPICFLKLEMPPSLVDVNVHPTKMEVRFQDSGTIYARLLTALREKFLTTNLATFVGDESNSDKPFTPINETFRNMDALEAESPAQEPAQSSLLWDTSPSVRGGGSVGQIPPFRPFEDTAGGWNFASPRRAGGGTSESLATAADEDSHADSQGAEPFSRIRKPLELHECADSTGRIAASHGGAERNESERNGSRAEEEDDKDGPEPEFRLTSRPVIQIHNRYIVTQCDEGIMVIDQHAMHERILYERLKRRVLSVSVDIQRLLTPEPIDLSAADAALILERRKDLESVGVLVEAFGGNTILVHGLPAAMFSFSKTNRSSVQDFVQSILDILHAEGSALTIDKFIDETLHAIACKAAVKAGQQLSYIEMQKLLDEYRSCAEADHCPHGRPSVLIWTCQELDKLFCRIL
ncbi:MAG: DNA mismatch repair endonuclease MutL [Planctomycetia bacterium]|nr:DNA mismatch repair endonuclease MutL [Planctomycetia bacterium]